MHSCIFEGFVSHCRFEPIEHRFQYRLYLLYIDLAEASELIGPGKMIANNRRSLCAFLDEDHFNGNSSLDSDIRDLVEQQTSTRPLGPIRLLTQLRHFGYYFSPLNLFYVWSTDNCRIESVVAEVNNTPWGERYCYVLWSGNQLDSNQLDSNQLDSNQLDSTLLKFQHPKQFHVSPFMAMDMNYRWRLNRPGSRLCVSLENLRDDTKLFAASLNLQRRELNRNQLRWMSLRYPLMTIQIIAAIHYQALQLWWKKCPVFQHPSQIKPPAPSSVPRS